MASSSVLIVSGDGIVPSFSWSLARAVRRLGAASGVVGAFHHFRRRRTPEGFARHIERRVEALGAAEGPVYLVGYSFGAVLAHAVPHLTPALRERLARVGLIAPAAMTGFSFHPAGWWGGHGPDDVPTAPAIERVAEMGIELLMLYGASDGPGAVPRDHPAIRRRILPGGHDLGGAYDALAGHLLAPRSAA